MSTKAFQLHGQERRDPVGLAAVKNVGETSARRKSWKRGRGGPFPVAFRYRGRDGSRTVNKKVLESPDQKRAFDSLGWRRPIVPPIDTMIDYGHGLQKMSKTPQSLLFGGAS